MGKSLELNNFYRAPSCKERAEKTIIEGIFFQHRKDLK